MPKRESIIEEMEITDALFDTYIDTLKIKPRAGIYFNKIQVEKIKDYHHVLNTKFKDTRKLDYYLNYPHTDESIRNDRGLKEGDMLYWDKYMALVDAGKVYLCYEMQLARKRVERYRKQYIYKPSEVEKGIEFIENENTHTKGQKGKFKLSLVQKALLDICWGFWEIRKIEKTDPDTMESYFIEDIRQVINKPIWIVSRGFGKAQDIDTIIPTPHGQRRFGDLQINDVVFGKNGKPIKVTGIFPQGELENYEITLADGRKSYSCNEHLWKVKDSRGKKIKILTVKDMLNLGLKSGHGNRFSLVTNEAVEYQERELKVNPYIFGAFMGDGCLTERQLTISSNDPFVVNKIGYILGLVPRKRTEKNYSYNFRLKDPIRTHKGPDIIFAQTKDLFNIRELAINKSIPIEYKESSIEQRWELLQGLFDTDGSVQNPRKNKKTVTFNTSSEQLAKDVSEILFSLGIINRIHSIKRSEKENREYQVHVNAPIDIKKKLFSLPRQLSKLNDYVEANQLFHYDHVKIKDIKKVGKAEMMCISVDAEDSLYLTNDYIVTHNTSTASAIANKGFMIDGEYGADVGLFANIKEQSGQLINASKTMLSAQGTLFDLLNYEKRLYKNREGIYFTDTNSQMMVKALDYSTLDGTNNYYNVFDEFHAYTEDVYKIVNDGSSRKRENWMTWVISTNGRTRGKTFDNYYQYWVDVLEEKIDDDSTFPFIYKLDDVSEIHDEKMWTKALPHLGITTDFKTIRDDIRNCANDPVAQAELLAKTFNLPMNNYQSYFTKEDCLGNKENFNLELFEGNDEQTYCMVILDKAEVGDIFTLGVQIPKFENGDWHHYFKLQNYIPRIALEDKPTNVKDNYLKYEANGELIVHEYKTNDEEFIFNQFADYMDTNNLYPVKFAFDPWHSKEFRRLFKEKWGDMEYPVGQYPKILSEPTKKYKLYLKYGFIHFDSELTTWAHSNVKVKIDANNGIFPNKKMAEGKIDPFMAQLNGLTCWEDPEVRQDIEFYFRND